MKAFTTLIAVLASVAVARRAPAGHVQHEARHAAPDHPWVKREPIHGELAVPVRVGLAQSNLDQGAEMLLDFADPQSSRFGTQLSADEVAALFAPAREGIEAVRAWLQASLPHRIIALSPSRQWFQFNATIAELQDLLHADYHEYEHATLGRFAVGCDAYHVPESVRPHVDFITPGVKTLELRKRSALGRREQHVGPKLTFVPNFDETGTSSCDRVISPACIKALYNVSDQLAVNKDNSMAVYETFDLFYNQTDLNLFFANFTPRIPQGTHPTYDKINGAPPPIGPEFFPNPEAGADLMIAYPLVYPTEVIEYQVDDKWYETTGAFNNDYIGIFNTFLDALDKSYCTYSAFGITGDSPGVDATYPDKHPGGYDHPEQCGAYKPANVISVSYNLGEDQLSVNYQRRQCNEWMKLGLQGVTVIFASGDYGVAEQGGTCERNGTLFAANSPNDCPFVTTVGATTLPPGGVPGTTREVASTSFATGGGFSNIFAPPAYQKPALNTYFAHHAPDYPYYNITLNATHHHGIYNRGGRGYPDLAAVGQNGAIYFQGKPAIVNGTSLSAPIIAGLITRINGARLNAGKKPVGFVNPTLYAHPEVFTDIVEGDNPGCGTNGFSAVPGWDPVSGLGTPKYNKLKEVFMSLP